MTETHSPPLRFKAVDPATGRASEPADLSIFDMSAGYAGEGLYRVSAVFSAPVALNQVPYRDDLILCQSTGLTDADGREIFLGDVVATTSGSTTYTDTGRPALNQMLIQFIPHWAQFRAVEYWDDPDDSPQYQIALKVNQSPVFVIGNVWESAEVRAERMRPLEERWKAGDDLGFRKAMLKRAQEAANG
jgi:uncharacterized phage protein (TIGR01671 family)